MINFSNMTNDELIRYTMTINLTPLERELATRLLDTVNTIESFVTVVNVTRHKEREKGIS